MEDKNIVCKDCGKTFVFTVREQEFYKEKGLEHDPVRCRECRAARKAKFAAKAEATPAAEEVKEEAPATTENTENN